MLFIILIPIIAVFATNKLGNRTQPARPDTFENPQGRVRIPLHTRTRPNAPLLPNELLCYTYGIAVNIAP